MPLSRYNALRGSRSVHKRKRKSYTRGILTRAPTAKRQRKQIYRNATQIRKLARYNNRHKVWTDYQYSNSIEPPAQVGTSLEGWSDFVALTNPVPWRPVLRMDNDVLESTRTFVRNCQLNMRYRLNSASDMSLSVFIVTPRKDAVNIDPNALVPGPHYIDNQVFDGLNVRLNPSIFKVHYSRYMTLTATTLGQLPTPAENVGNPNTTWRKGQVNLPLRMSIRQPTIIGPANSWKLKEFATMPFYHKYYLLVYWSSTCPVPGAGVELPQISFDALYTCINTD